MASPGGIWVPMAQRILRQAVAVGARASQALRSKAAAAARGELEPIAVRATYRDQPVHPAALRRQSASGYVKRWFSSVSSPHAAHRFFTASARQQAARHAASVPRYADRVAFLKSPVATQAVWTTAGRSPFASTLRPNLTAGAFPRTAGGYSAGAGARYFSHTPAAPAQVMQNVSQAMRAFLVGGHRARFDGTDARGRPCYKAISALEEAVARKLTVPPLPALVAGAFVDFPLNPTITALAAATSFGLGATAAAANHTNSTLHTEGFLDVLSVDFARALKEYSAVLNDLKRLAALGDLPVGLHVADGTGSASTVLRVRFPGVDADTVDRLCDDLGITRGVVGQDPGLDEDTANHAALRFPYAPDAFSSSSPVPHALTSPGGSERSRDSSALVSTVSSSMTTGPLLVSYDAEDDADSFADAYYFEATSPPHNGAADSHGEWLSAGASSSRRSAVDDDLSVVGSPPLPAHGVHGSTSPSVADFEGLEGVYRFLEACDRVQARA